MHRTGLIALAWLVASAGVAGAQDASTSDAGAESASATEVDGRIDQEIGALLGVELGGHTSAGGVQVSGSYLYRLSEEDWFDGGVAFTFGGGSAECFRDRDDDVQCDHGPASGFGGELSAGVRRYFPGQGIFRPYARAGVALRLVSFSADDVRGFAVPVFLGGGVRAEVADRIVVVGGATARLGVGFFNRGLGAERQISLAVAGGVEFALD